MAVAREVEPFAHASRMLSTGRGGQGGEGPGAGALLAARSIGHGHGTFRRPGQGQSLGVAAPAAPPRAPRQRAVTPPTEARAFLKPRRTPMVPGGARTPQPENHSLRPRFQPWPERPANAPREASMGGSPTARQGAPQEPRAERPRRPPRAGCDRAPHALWAGAGPRGHLCQALRADPSPRSAAPSAQDAALRNGGDERGCRPAPARRAWRPSILCAPEPELVRVGPPLPLQPAAGWASGDRPKARSSGGSAKP